MASASVVPASGLRELSSNVVDLVRLPEEMNDMKIRDEKEMEATVINGNGTETGHIIVTKIGGGNGQPKQTISYMAERVVGQGSFGVVFQAKCLETGETVAIKKVLQDKRYKNRELQTMRLLDHPNVVCLKHCFFSTTDNEELYLNLVLEYVPETVHRVIKHYNKMNQRMPLIYVKLYMYQICRALAYIHRNIGLCHRDIKPQNLLVNPHTHQLKLCDFGSAKVLVKGEPNISYICSRYYRAPELIFGATEYTTAIDIWSAGCVLAELLLGQPLFPGESGVDQLVEIIKVLGTPTREEIKCMNPNYTEFKFPQIKAHPWHKIFHKGMPPEAVDLVSRLLQYSPNLRCTALDALIHPFFDELRDPSSHLPNGRILPPLFNFRPREIKEVPVEVLVKLIPEHARKQSGVGKTSVRRGKEDDDPREETETDDGGRKIAMIRKKAEGNDGQREEEKIAKFYELIRSNREARDLRRFELQGSAEGESERESKKMRAADGGGQSSWIPSFKWEDFTGTPMEFPNSVAGGRIKIKKNDDRSVPQENQSPPDDDGLDLKLAL
ncbi:hypothetical protein Nepgr_029856 [Nepenthes gracilis]|uniref:non-specific serine/threonine protein kinase n=1 Tax=Nepenthes gracilis TaxID=150966 RepID=A0AAD3TFB3_NEPGR|nr:hypothetical protein Nepgr_029856 [Nepenthes gracilis]